MTVKKSASKPAKQAGKTKSAAQAATKLKPKARKTWKQDIIAARDKAKSSYVVDINKELAKMKLPPITARERDQAIGRIDNNQKPGKSQDKRSGNGGNRKGSGRKKGAATKKTREIADKLVESGDLTPLEYMLQVLKEGPAELRRQFDEGAMDQTEYSIRLQEHIKRRDNMAEKAAPYIHPRLSSIQATVETDAQRKWLDMMEEVGDAG